MNLARRRFLFMAPAIIAAPKLMRVHSLAAELLKPIDDDFTTESMTFTARERYAVGWMDARVFRQIVEPILREHFDGAYDATVPPPPPLRIASHRARIQAHEAVDHRRLTGESAWFLRGAVPLPQHQHHGATADHDAAGVSSSTDKSATALDCEP